MLSLQDFCEKMKISIIIVNYNVAYFLEQCLRSVYRAIDNIDAEVFVVDNNSVDNSVELVKQHFPQVKLIANTKNLGFSKANNQAIRMSSGEYVLLLNPDTVVEPDTFEKVLAFMDEHSQCGALGVKMVDGKGKFLPESKRSLPIPSVAFYKIFGLSALFKKSKRFGKYHLTYLDENEINKVEVLSGAFMLLRKTALDKVGLLDEDYFMYGEDIDLSYRIAQGGYDNYYFPQTRIIHYKGESTKKSSINYVIVFYKAMQIFAQKHFSANNAKLFNFLISLAICLRAALAIAKRVVLKLLMPFVDFLFIYGGLLACAFYWHARIMPDNEQYSNVFLYVILPVYALVWVLCIFFNKGYKIPINVQKVSKGVVTGAVVLLLGYALMSEQWRFSRAVLLLGIGWTFVVTSLLRAIVGKLHLQNYPLENNVRHRILIIGDEQSVVKVDNLLRKVNYTTDFIGYVYYLEEEKPNKNYIGHIGQLNEIIDVYKIEELVFCEQNFSIKQIINLMTTLSSANLDYKIAPENGNYIIGSHSISTSGEMYAMNINSIGNKDNRIKKRLFDISVSLFLLCTFVLNVWVVKNKGKYVKNIFACLLGKKTWIGYLSASIDRNADLPAIKQGVLAFSEHLHITDPDLIAQINSFYAKDYRVLNDLQALLKTFKEAGR